MKEFREDDRAKILQFMRENPLATVITLGEDSGPVATHVPILIREDGDALTLRGHVMRKTDHWNGFVANPKVLAIFHGPNCPVLASWYPEKDNGGTWNYMVAHAHGTMTLLPQADLVELLRDLKSTYEEDAGAGFDNLSQEYLGRMLPPIQAFEIKVDRLEAVFKLSQNRDDSSFANIVEQLTARGGQSAEVARQMKLNREH